MEEVVAGGGGGHAWNGQGFGPLGGRRREPAAETMVAEVLLVLIHHLEVTTQ